MNNVMAPSRTHTLGPLVFEMSGSSSLHPSRAEYHHDDPSAGPMFSVPVIRLPERSAQASLRARPRDPPGTPSRIRSCRPRDRSGGGRRRGRRRAWRPLSARCRPAWKARRWCGVDRVPVQPVQRLRRAVDEIEAFGPVIPYQTLTPAEREVAQTLDQHEASRCIVHTVAAHGTLDSRPLSYAAPWG